MRLFKSRFQTIALSFICTVTLIACQANSDGHNKLSEKASTSAAENSTLNRTQVDFNKNWQFRLADTRGAFLFDEVSKQQQWETIDVPHDWSVALPYTQENTASSTGFKQGGIGWYRKTFDIKKSDFQRTLWLEFDGIYNNSSIWINGSFAGERPNGYTSFKVDLNEYMVEGENQISIKVDRTAYNDSRWYTGSGIYRDVRLVSVNKQHIAHWGVQITSHKVSSKSAELALNTTLNLSTPANQQNLQLISEIKNAKGELVASGTKRIDSQSTSTPTILTNIKIERPALWQLDKPHLYTAHISLSRQNDDGNMQTLDTYEQTFGIRSIAFTADKGFFLNGKQTKIKGVNLHHDVGALGAAATKAAWRYRLKKLQSIGVNAIRLSHNPHSPQLLELADEMGFLVMAETFDDWLQAKKKSVVFLSDNAGSGDAISSYTEHFAKWAERDLRDLIKRDFNHPSVIMWSIGNEVEWTYPYYSQSQMFDEEKADYYGAKPPIYEPKRVLENYKKVKGEGPDNLSRTAHYLTKIVKSIDTSRPVTAGLVIPSVGFVSGYTDALDVVGFNYRAQEYDTAHKTYPNKPIIGSENWGTWAEWNAVKEREFVPGIFVWTGFAYKGEAGPWPRKGLEISFFDFAGNKTPRGHLFETLWVEKPKVYMATIAAKDSEYQFDKDKGWTFTERTHPIKQMQWLRKWEWYGVSDTWNYSKNEDVTVHVYANTEQTELFINDKSLGKQTLSDAQNGILFWQLPFAQGELKVVGYNQGKKVAEYALNTHGEAAKIALHPDKLTLSADTYDLAHIHAKIIDKNGNTVVLDSKDVEFTVSGAANLVAVDNGWENNVQIATNSSINTHMGKALGIVRSNGEKGEIRVTAHVEGLAPVSIVLQAEDPSHLSQFTSLFNGKDLNQWTEKTYGFAAGKDPDATFSVHEGAIRVDYTQYEGQFSDRFSHLYFNQAFENFHLKLEYRFRGEFYPGAPNHALLNSGIMFHSQSPQSMPIEQNWPLSVEMQLLAGITPGQSRTTGNVCTPGTDVSLNNTVAKPHCIYSDSDTYYGDQWVSAELIVNNKKVSQYINGQLVLEYTDPKIGFTGTIKGIDKNKWSPGQALTRGFIGLQSEGHPVDFRNISIKEL